MDLRDVGGSADPARPAERLVRLLVATRGRDLQRLRTRLLRKDASGVTGVARVGTSCSAASGRQPVVCFLGTSLAVLGRRESAVLVVGLHHVGNIAAVLRPLLLGRPRVRVLRSHVGQIDAASAIGGVLVLLLVARELAIMLLLANGAAIEVHLGLVAWSRVAEAVPFLESGLVQGRHHEQVGRHLGGRRYLLLRLVLLLPLQCHRGSSRAPYSLHVVPVLEKSRLAILGPQAWGEDGLGLAWVVDLPQLHLLELELVWSLLGASLGLADLLRLLEHVGLPWRQRCLVVEVAAR